VDDEGAGRLVGVAEIDGAGAAAWGVAGGAEAARGRDPGGIEAGEVARIDRDAAAAAAAAAAGANRAGPGQLPDVDPGPAAGAGAPQIGFGAVGPDRPVQGQRPGGQAHQPAAAAAAGSSGAAAARLVRVGVVAVDGVGGGAAQATVGAVAVGARF